MSERTHSRTRERDQNGRLAVRVYYLLIGVSLALAALYGWHLWFSD